MSSLKDIYNTYTAGASDMDGKTLVKILKDNDMVDKKLTVTDIDLMFTKHKDRGAKKISYAQFEKILEEVATKKKCTVEEVHTKLTEGGGPKFSGTKTDAVRLHDDKSTYTGAHAHGGPSTGGAAGLADICDRGESDVRGISKASAAAAKK